MLFQDSFEVVNPLGSGKCKRKILAVYYTLGNMQHSSRSTVDQLQLALLCKESFFKKFGAEKFFANLISDLIVLESTGMVINGKCIRGTVASILGDNLGSHCIGGFTENFSTASHMCRYCTISRLELQENHAFHQGQKRTPALYDQAILEIEANDDVITVDGLKFKLFSCEPTRIATMHCTRFI